MRDSFQRTRDREVMLTASRRSYYSFAFSASCGSLLGLSKHLVDSKSIEQLRSSAHVSGGPGSVSDTVTPSFLPYQSKPPRSSLSFVRRLETLFATISLDVSLQVVVK